jgi:hypothetical protein
MSPGSGIGSRPGPAVLRWSSRPRPGRPASDPRGPRRRPAVPAAPARPAPRRSIPRGSPADVMGGVQDQVVTTDMDTLATALYVKTDDLLKGSPYLARWRPAAGIAPKLTDAELATLAVMQALLGFASESRWLRHARAHLGHPVSLSSAPARVQQAAAGLGSADHGRRLAQRQNRSTHPPVPDRIRSLTWNRSSSRAGVAGRRRCRSAVSTTAISRSPSSPSGFSAGSLPSFASGVSLLFDVLTRTKIADPDARGDGWSAADHSRRPLSSAILASRSGYEARSRAVHVRAAIVTLTHDRADVADTK